MKDSDTGSKTRRPMKRANKTGWAGMVAKIERDFAEHKASKEESAADRAARRTADATVGIQRLTWVLAAVAALTLCELIEGGADTKALVEASKKQARAAEQFADTAGLINQNVNDAVGKLDAQAKATEAAMKSQERAYVTVEIHSLFPDQPQRPPLLSVTPGQAEAVGLSAGSHWCDEIDNINVGRTPTIGERTTAFATTDQNPRRTIEAFAPPPYPYRAGTVGQTSMFHRTCTTEIVDAVAFGEIMRKGLNIFTYGVTQYRDVYGDYHETGFCLILASTGDVRGCGYGSWFDKRPGRRQQNQAN
jgi:hypothetical protein